jgi:Mor family transcriptional regulator
MEYKPWMDYITVEDMPNDDIKFVAEHSGIKAALALILTCPGLTVTIPKNAFKIIKERHIMKTYDGTKYSVNKLAIDCETSQRNIYKIIKRNLSKQK